MGNKHGLQNERAWRDWLRRYQPALLEAGLPLAVIEQPRRWLYFTEHGDYPDVDGQPLANVDDLDADQRLQLCCILETMAVEMCCSPCLLAQLQAELGR